MAWYRPNDIGEALEILDEQRPVVVCGGTDQFVNWPRRKTDYEERDWLSLEGIQALRDIEMDGGDLVIGAAVTASQIWSSSVCGQIPALQDAARVVGGWQIQNRASLGGNLVNASPAADMVVPLVAYDASVVLQSRDFIRTLPIREFLQGPRKTSLKNNEILVKVRIPKAVLGKPQLFLRLDQRGGTDISLVSVAAVMHLEEKGVEWAKLAVGAANPVPFSLPEADAALKGRLNGATIEAIARQYADAAQPISDIRASAEYRTRMIEVFIKRALAELIPGEEFEEVRG